MTTFKRFFSVVTLLALAACGGGGGSGGASPLLPGAGAGTGGATSGNAAVSTVKIAISSTEISSTTPATVTATVTDSAGTPVPNAVVAFSTTRNTLAAVAPASVLTSAQGVATARLTSLASGTEGADEVVALVTTTGTTQISARVSFSVKPEAPTLVGTVSSSSITSTAPATYRVILRDATGAVVPNTVVTFASASNLVTFTPASQVTSATGEASAVVSPRTAASNGADLLRASAVVRGVTISAAESPVQIATSAPTGTPTLDLSVSSLSISAASPATVVATLRDAQGRGVGGQVITFSVARGLAVTNIATALTQSDAANLGKAIVVLSPANASSAGADDVSASVSYAGTALQRSQGFQVQATPVTLVSLEPGVTSLSAYGQTTLTLSLSGASVTSPVNISINSSCVSQGKAAISPSTFTATTNTVTMQYRDNGCGAVQATDQLQAVVTATGASLQRTLPIATPNSSSIAFRSASPEQIFLKGSGFAETSVLTFEVRDAAGNPLPNQVVELRLQTGAGGVTMEGLSVTSPNAFTLTSNALGLVAVRVNSGTLPTPVRVSARLAAVPSIATVSSNLSVAVGLPSQLNFSMSQGTINIEGYNIDGTTNTYQIIAADRSGNPVPAGTSINFVTEGGQVEAVKQTALVNGIARTAANFVSSEPRPIDGRVTVTAYALGEESFLDLNGDNAYTPGEPFQDLGNVFKDRNFNGVFDSLDEFVQLNINNSRPCQAPGDNLLLLDASIPSITSSCDGVWSGAGQVYVRRSVETVLSTSTARPLWASTSNGDAGGLDGSCRKITLRVGPETSQTGVFTQVTSGETWYGGSGGTLNFIVGDANPGSAAQGLLPRLNPMAAGTRISVSTPDTGLTVAVGGGSPVASTSSASLASVAYSFIPPKSEGTIFVTFTSPGGTGTTVAVRVVNGPRPAGSACP